MTRTLNPMKRNPTGRLKHELLHSILRDERWHSTSELVRRVGHTFAGAKWKLTGYGYSIEKRRHPTKPRQWQYRLTDQAAG